MARYEFTDPDHARQTAVESITEFYNKQRRHTKINNGSPIAYETTADLLGRHLRASARRSQPSLVNDPGY